MNCVLYYREKLYQLSACTCTCTCCTFFSMASLTIERVSPLSSLAGVWLSHTAVMLAPYLVQGKAIRYMGVSSKAIRCMGVSSKAIRCMGVSREQGKAIRCMGVSSKAIRCMGVSREQGKAIRCMGVSREQEKAITISKVHSVKLDAWELVESRRRQ